MNFGYGDYWWYRYFVAPVFGTACYLLGTVLLFLVSAGHWRVTSWPNFETSKESLLEPWRIRIGSRIYFSADAAMATGFGALILAIMTLLCLWGAGVFNR